MEKTGLFTRLHNPKRGPFACVLNGVTVAVSDEHPVISFKRTVDGRDYAGAIYIHRAVMLDEALFNRRVQYCLDDFMDHCAAKSNRHGALDL